MSEYSDLHKGHREEPLGSSFEAKVKVTPIIHYCGTGGERPAYLHFRIESEAGESINWGAGDACLSSHPIEESKIRWREMAEYVGRFLSNAQINATLLLIQEVSGLTSLPQSRIPAIWEAIEKGIDRGMDISKMELDDEILESLDGKAEMEAYIDFFTMLLIQSEMTKSRILGEVMPTLEPLNFTERLINKAIENMAQSQKETDRPKRFTREWFNQAWSDARKVFGTPHGVYYYVPKTRNDELRERYHDKCKELRGK